MFKINHISNNSIVLPVEIDKSLTPQSPIPIISTDNNEIEEKSLSYFPSILSKEENNHEQKLLDSTNNSEEKENIFLDRKKLVKFITIKEEGKNSDKKGNFCNSKFNEGKWNKNEHLQFLKGISLYENKWKEVQKLVITRSVGQVRSHAQKYFLKYRSLLNFNKNTFKNIKFLLKKIKELDKRFNLEEKPEKNIFFSLEQNILGKNIKLKRRHIFKRIQRKIVFKNININGKRIKENNEDIIEDNNETNTNLENTGNFPLFEQKNLDDDISLDDISINQNNELNKSSHNNIFVGINNCKEYNTISRINKKFFC